MKVLFITHYTELYGANRSLLTLLENLSRQGVHPFLLSPSEGDVTSQARRMGIPCFIIPYYKSVHFRRFTSWLKAPLRVAVNSIATLRINRLVRKQRIDIVYSNSLIFLGGAQVAKQTRRPHVWHVRELGLMENTFRYDLGIRFAKSQLARSDAVVCVSKAVANSEVLNIPGLKKHVVYNGVFSGDKMGKYPRFLFTPPATFCCVGMFTPYKNQIEVLQSLRMLREAGVDLKIVFAGEGPCVDDCMNFCREHGLSDAVTFLGYVPNPDKVYSDSHIFISPFLGEAMGRVTAEAMSHGLPVIGKNSGGTGELVEHGVNGYLYDTAEELAEFMSELAGNPSRVRELGSASLRIARDRFSTEAYVRNVRDILETVYSETGPR